MNALITHFEQHFMNTQQFIERYMSIDVLIVNKLLLKGSQWRHHFSLYNSPFDAKQLSGTGSGCDKFWWLQSKWKTSPAMNNMVFYLILSHLVGYPIKAEWRIYASVNYAIICSDNGLSHGRRQYIIWTNTGILLIRTSGTNFSEILGAIHTFSFKKMHLKMSSGKWRPFRPGLNVLKLQ